METFICFHFLTRPTAWKFHGRSKQQPERESSSNRLYWKTSRVLGLKLENSISTLSWARNSRFPQFQAPFSRTRTEVFHAQHAAIRSSGRKRRKLFWIQGPLPSTGHRRDKLSTKAVEHQWSKKKKKKKKKRKWRISLKFLDHRHDFSGREIFVWLN